MNTVEQIKNSIKGAARLKTPHFNVTNCCMDPSIWSDISLLSKDYDIINYHMYTDRYSFDLEGSLFKGVGRGVTSRKIIPHMSDAFLLDTLVRDLIDTDYLSMLRNIIKVVNLDTSSCGVEHLMLNRPFDVKYVFTCKELEDHYRKYIPNDAQTHIARNYTNTEMFFDQNKDRRNVSIMVNTIENWDFPPDLKNIHMVSSSKPCLESFAEILNNHKTYIQVGSLYDFRPMYAMACGCIPILVIADESLYNPSILRNGENCILTKSMEEAIDTAAMLNSNDKLLNSIKKNIPDTMKFFNNKEETQDSWSDIFNSYRR